MARTNWTGPRILAALVLVGTVLYFAGGQAGFFAVTQAQQDVPALNGTCQLIKECSSVNDCNTICAQYTRCSVNTHKDNLITCINGEEREPQFTEVASEAQSNEQQGAGGSSE